MSLRSSLHEKTVMGLWMADSSRYESCSDCGADAHGIFMAGCVVPNKETIWRNPNCYLIRILIWRGVGGIFFGPDFLDDESANELRLCANRRGFFSRAQPRAVRFVSTNGRFWQVRSTVQCVRQRCHSRFGPVLRSGCDSPIFVGSQDVELDAQMADWNSIDVDFGFSPNDRGFEPRG